MPVAGSAFGGDPPTVLGWEHSRGQPPLRSGVPRPAALRRLGRLRKPPIPLRGSAPPPCAAKAPLRLGTCRVAADWPRSSENPHRLRQSLLGSTASARSLAGFTLLELMIVILIMGVFAGSSIPLFRRTYANLQREVFAYDLAKLFEYAARRAVTTETPVRVHFAAQSRQYWLLEAEAAGPQADRAFTRISGRAGIVHAVPEILTINPSVQDVTFYPDGRTETFQVTILDHARQGYTLTTQVWTGRVTVTKTHGT